MTAELPTMQQVINYVRENPDCKSKDIAKHFGCTTKDVNRNRGEYIGIYSNPAIISTDYKHRAKATEPEPEPEGNVCPICLEPPTKPVSGGCCPYPMCRECFIELENSDSENYDKCPHCRETFPWAMPDHDAIDEIVQERVQHIQSQLEMQTGQLRSQLQQLTRLQQELARARATAEPEPEPVVTWGPLTLTGDLARRHLAQTTPEESEATAEQTRQSLMATAEQARQRMPVRLRVRD